MFSNTQISMGIRPYNETKAYSGIKPKGYLQNLDLEIFSLNKMSDEFLEKVKSFNNRITLYEFFIYKETKDSYYKEKNIIGWLVENNFGEVILEELCKTNKVNGNLAKRQKALDFCKEFINEEATKC